MSYGGYCLFVASLFVCIVLGVWVLLVSFLFAAVFLCLCVASCACECVNCVVFVFVAFACCCWLLDVVYVWGGDCLFVVRLFCVRGFVCVWCRCSLFFFCDYVPVFVVLVCGLLFMMCLFMGGVCGLLMIMIVCVLVLGWFYGFVALVL